MTTETLPELSTRKPYPKNRKSRGSTIMPRNRLVQGVGITDADYVVSHADPFYRIWHGFLNRCANAAKFPHHAGCSVDPRWFSFAAFRAWMIEQPWEGNYLDKDLLVPGNKIYGPDTCVFVSPRVNAVLNTNPKSRGQFPIGVCKRGNRFGAQINRGSGSVYLGSASTPMKAHALWQLAKIKVLRELAEEQVDSRVYDRLLMEADLLTFENENNTESVR